MKKIIMIMLFLVYSNADIKCNRLLSKYNINKDIHSIIGWKRICNYNLLNMYSNKHIDNNDTYYICNKCFIIPNVTIGTTLRSTK